MALVQEDAARRLTKLADDILQQLSQPVANDCIHLCGNSLLTNIDTQPYEVLTHATAMLKTYPCAHVPMKWRRVFEESSLHLAVQQLRQQVRDMDTLISSTSIDNDKKRRRVSNEHAIHDQRFDKFLEETVKVFDRAIIIAGAPGRRDTLEYAISELDATVRNRFDCAVQHQYLVIAPPGPLATQSPIQRYSETPDIVAFQDHLDTSGKPIIISQSLEHWPARQLWHDMAYLKRCSVGGFRWVPVEIGSSYTDENWSQRLMPFKDFIDDYLMPEKPAAVGYLAQHDLFLQIPQLRNDIMTPDYCWSSPLQPTGVAAQTPGVNIQPLSEPLANAWLGPASTKTPLHTDPYHNLLCQVFGYKYIRLYAPDQRHKLYPQGTDELGIDMSNTSMCDVQPFRPEIPGVPPMPGRDGPARLRHRQAFRAFESADYVEAILAPGECLYIPLGWWHYVESLTPSFSVSFWFN